jgi:hypothetical protein
LLFLLLWYAVSVRDRVKPATRDRVKTGHLRK